MTLFNDVSFISGLILLSTTMSEAETCPSYGELRLLEDAVKSNGLIEICLGGNWARICDDNWGWLEATIACRQLGLQSNYAQAVYGLKGSENTTQYRFQCQGSESRLTDCTVMECSQNREAGLLCSNDDTVRLNGELIEVCYNGRWGLICADGWNSDLLTRKFICNQLNMSSNHPRMLRHSAAHFDGLVILGDIACTGEERKLVECSRGGYRNFTNCSEIAAIQCEAREVCNVSHGVRLTQFDSNREGRLEVCVEGIWKSMCRNSVSDNVVRVACRQLNYAARGSIYTERESVNKFLETIVPIAITKISCKGNESSLVNCSFDGAGENNCDHVDDIIISCDVRECQEGDVRLADMWLSTSGRIEICLDGLWGVICDDRWDYRDAKVACRQLNYDGKSYPLQSYGSRQRPIFHIDDVHCKGSEERIIECSHGGLGVHDCHTGSQEAGVICTNVTCTDGEVHLVGGDDVSRGRVLYCHEGTWYSLCSNGWEDQGPEAKIICRDIGHYHQKPVVVNYGRGDDPILPFSISCSTDSNSNFSSCSRTKLNVSQCQNVAGVDCSASCSIRGYTDCRNCGSRESCWARNCNCYSDCYLYGDCCSDVSNVANCIVQECETGDVRLVGGVTNSTGRLEVCGNGMWGKVCNRYKYWDKNNARAVCRQLGFSDGGAYAMEDDELSNIFGKSNRPTLLGEIHCTGEEPGWLECTHFSIGWHTCGIGTSNVPDVIISCPVSGMNGSVSVSCEEGDVRLVDGFKISNGHVEFCRHRTWGKVCKDGWSDNNARVICRQLGYNPDDSLAAEEFLGGEDKLGVLSGVSCSGNEENLSFCSSKGPKKSCEAAGVTCEAMKEVERCTERHTMDPQSFSACQTYTIQTEVCADTLKLGNDYVFIAKRFGTQQNLSQSLNTNITAARELLVSQDDMCLTLMKKLLCAYYLPHCGNSSNPQLPMSICQLECQIVQKHCPAVWNATAQVFGSTGFLSCNDTSYTLYPLPHCCNGAGIEMLAYSSSEAKDGWPGIAAGIPALVILLVMTTLVTIVSYIVIRRRRRSINIEMMTLDVMSSTNCPREQCMDVSTKVDNRACNETMLCDNISREKHSSIALSTIGVPNTYCVPVPQHVTKQDPEEDRLSMPSYCVRQLKLGNFIIMYKDVTLLQCIGEGEFGIVYKARLARHVQEVAVKTLKGYYGQDEVDKFLEESLKMSHFKHVHVMGLIGVCLDGPAPLIVMPFMSNGSLLTYLRSERGKLIMSDENDDDEIECVQKRLIAMCCQIASGMEYLSDEKYIHRDLAARNCMININFLIKITDFGLSEDVFDKNYFRQGTHENVVKLPVKWMAPESLSDGHFSEKSDVWSYGVTMWEIFSGGKAPYSGISPRSLLKQLEDGYRMPAPSNASCNENIYEMMCKCWKMSPFQRPSFKDIHFNISQYISHIGGYLEIGINPFSGSFLESEAVKGDDEMVAHYKE